MVAPKTSVYRLAPLTRTRSGRPSFASRNRHERRRHRYPARCSRHAPRDYRDTVFLPQTSFPMRGDLPKKEPQILARWEAMELWGKLRAASAGRPLFILHDGPPYANGNIHIGTALNKILKDVINRTRQMAGYDADYIPGWDCHGLPIEWKIEEEYRAGRQGQGRGPDPRVPRRMPRLRGALDGGAGAEFRRLGVEGDLAQRYATMDSPSEAAIAGEICKFLLNGALYRGLRPVMWSPVEKTALAEAEIEYHDHTSHDDLGALPGRHGVGAGDWMARRS